MKKFLVIVIILLVAVLMTQMVPDKAAHKAAMMAAIKEYVDEEAENKRLGDNVLTDLGKGIVTKTIEVALNSKLKVSNYYLFNTTYVKHSGKNQTLSLGIFGHVFTFDKKMLREALEDAAKAKEDAKNEKKTAKEAAKEAKKLQRQLEKEQRKREKEQRKAEKKQRKAEKRKK
jgi:hypothetical protein